MSDRSYCRYSRQYLRYFGYVGYYSKHRLSMILIKLYQTSILIIWIFEVITQITWGQTLWSLRDCYQVKGQKDRCMIQSHKKIKNGVPSENFEAGLKCVFFCVCVGVGVWECVCVGIKSQNQNHDLYQH